MEGAAEVPHEITLFDALAGRLCELSGQGATCLASVAFLLVKEAQRRHVLTAWIQVVHVTSRPAAPFYAPDLLDLGLDLAALPFVLTRDLTEAGRAATHLLRSGALALLVIDTTSASASNDSRTDTGPDLPLPLMSRLVGLAQKHHTALVVLTTKPAHSPSLGSLVSFHAHVDLARTRTPHEDGFSHLTCRLVVEKDKRRGPGLTLSLPFRGPPGLR